MNPGQHQSDPEKGPEMRGLLTPTPASPPGYAAVYQPPTYMTTQDRPRNARRRRFWHFFACSFLFFFALHLLLHGRHFRHGFHNHPWFGNGSESEETPAKYSPSICQENVDWIEDPDQPYGFPYRAHALLTLPVSADELSFIAEGQHAHGSIDISQSGDEGANAVVDVEIEYRTREVFADTIVCRTHPGENKFGLGIFTPDYRHPHSERQLRFHIHVRLPRSDHLLINALRTDLPLFVHHLADLENSVYFEELTLNTENTPITIDSLAGNHVRARSRNSPIRGKFNVSSELDLQTANTPIIVRANLVSGGGEQPTRAVLRTSNGHIDSEVTLQANTLSATGGRFSVEAYTSNAPLDVSVADAPVDHTLALRASTSNSPARVSLHETYEGAFDLKSAIFFPPSVQWDAEAADPAGKGRKRSVQLQTARRGSVHGTAWWEAGGARKGYVAVETSNSPLQFKL